MISLLKNEWIKLWTKKQPWIFVILIVVITVGISFLYQALESNMGSGNQSGDWQVGLEMEIESDQELMNSSDAEAWDRDMAEMRVEQNQAYLEAGVNPNAVTNISFLNDTFLMAASFITLFSVIVASTVVSSELNTGTIKQLLIRPFERWQFLLSKFIIVVLFSLILIVILFVTMLLMGTILFETASWGSAVLEWGAEGNFVAPGHELIFSKLGLYTLNMLVFVIISFCISTLFKSQALAVGVGIFTLFFTNISQPFGMLLENKAWYKFIILPHLSLPEYARQGTLIEGVTLPFSLMIIAVYCIILMTITTVYFQKKDIAY
ncbi:MULTISPECIES: ABC transporter permease [Bacillaceae]|uniref:ABC transporter permease n=1 Tax=Evansella alkalicola TaxID=745819 RepID=A0ABS6JNF4_9BACI|nr:MULTISPECIES: ABC transporter permease subunit [Bacillaceae]MBU9720080.1 ABC transporter permease [Bacillus alkalicola]